MSEEHWIDSHEHNIDSVANENGWDVNRKGETGPIEFIHPDTEGYMSVVRSTNTGTFRIDYYESDYDTDESVFDSPEPTYSDSFGLGEPLNMIEMVEHRLHHHTS